MRQGEWSASGQHWCPEDVSTNTSGEAQQRALQSAALETSASAGTSTRVTNEEVAARGALPGRNFEPSHVAVVGERLLDVLVIAGYCAVAGVERIGHVHCTAAPELRRAEKQWCAPHHVSFTPALSSALRIKCRPWSKCNCFHTTAAAYPCTETALVPALRRLPHRAAAASARAPQAPAPDLDARAARAVREGMRCAWRH